MAEDEKRTGRQLLPLLHNILKQNDCNCQKVLLTLVLFVPRNPRRDTSSLRSKAKKKRRYRDSRKNRGRLSRRLSKNTKTGCIRKTKKN